MKTRLIFLLPLLWLVMGCSDSDSDSKSITLKVSETSFKNISPDGETITLNIKSNTNWNISSNNKWCTPEVISGENSGKIQIDINKNNEVYSRAATVTVEADGTQEKILFVQDGKKLSDQEIESHHYKLPVVFQVLYKDENDEKQYIRKNRASDLIIACNKYYQNLLGSNSVDMNLEFVLATQDPEGNTLSEPGVNRIKVDEPTMDCKEFMNNKDNLRYLWDTDRYINIILYTFSNKNILGISNLPYTVAPDKIEGLNQLSFLPEHSSLSYPHCLSINNAYIYDKPNMESTYNYISTDPIVTIAHELGHYLGLFHAFNEGEEDDTDICEDTDFCDDTPPYNRTEYMSFLDWYISERGGYINKSDLPLLIKRKSCIDGKEYTPNNIMDYEVSWVNRFTPNQKERVRNVLALSPLVPGPKESRGLTRAATGIQEFPMRMIQ